MEFRTIERDELDAFQLSLSYAFSEPAPDEDEVKSERRRLEPDRCFAAFDEGEIVGCAGAFTWKTTVPGGSAVGTACITTVGVVPTHRRRGITRELIGRLLAQARERGEPLATLFASEAAIYGRFGFGLATSGLDVDVLVERAAFIPSHVPHGRTRLLGRDDALPLMKRVYDAAARPGTTTLSDDDFDWYYTEPSKREDRTFHAVHEDDDGEPDAYAVYKAKHRWPAGLPHVELKVRHLLGATPQGIADMWRYLLDVDLVARVRADNRPVDDALRWLLLEPRAMRARLFDGLYARPVDVPAALTQRGYVADGRIVIRVADAFMPQNDGTYELVAGPQPLCVRTTADPDLDADVNAIGAVYLGGVSWGALARAGRVVEHTAGALARADAMFAADPPPWAPLGF